MFLLEKLPKESTQSAEEPTGAGILLTRSIGDELSTRLRTPWTPPYCKNDSIRWTTPTSWNIEVIVN